jgi:hypothetical protein
MGVSLGNTADLRLKDFGNIFCNMITNSISLYCNGTCMRQGSAASSSWENYHIVGEPMHTANLFLGNFKKNGKFSFMFLLVG